LTEVRNDISRKTSPTRHSHSGTAGRAQSAARCPGLAPRELGSGCASCSDEAVGGHPRRFVRLQHRTLTAPERPHTSARQQSVGAERLLLVSRGATTWYLEGMADHYTLRLAPGVRQRLSEWARRAGIQERTLAQRYVEEGLRHDAHPLIQFLDGPSGRRASLLGRGLDVWEVIATVRDNNGSMAEAAEYLQIPAGLVEAAVAYYGEYRDEIDREIELNEAEYERGRAAAAAGEQALRS
jgi:hypothetical protein